MFKYPSVILAHRGAGVFAPENTLAAMKVGFSMGFHAVEFDVMLTRDNVPVLMHDCTAGRTFKHDDCNSLISEAFEYNELASVDAGSWFSISPRTLSSRTFDREPVPSFASVFDYCLEQNIWMNIEIKPCPGHEEATGRVVAEHLQRALAQGRLEATRYPLFSSFAPDSLQAAQLVCPTIPRALLVSGAIPTDWRRRMEDVGAAALHVDHSHLTQALAREIKVTGCGLFCYTVNELERAREILEWGVDALCTDRLDIVSEEALARYFR